MKKTAILSAVIFAAPFAAFAQTGNLSNIQQLVQSIGNIVAILIPILIAIALIAFFWGLIKYIWGGGKDTAKGKSIMIAGIISLFVMVSIYGIIAFAQNALLGGTPGQNINAPRVPSQ